MRNFVILGIDEMRRLERLGKYEKIMAILKSNVTQLMCLEDSRVLRGIRRPSRFTRQPVHRRRPQ